MGEFYEKKSELYKLICLNAYADHLKKNKNWYSIVLFTLSFAFLAFMLFIVDAPYFMALVGNIVLGLAIRKFFMNRQDKIIEEIKSFCHKHNIDISQGL